ncbi:hypothetical protein [Azonexus sp.]|jgi:hypothetical protein|nr:hypothetical protein [Azonexus sp.]
MKLVIAALMALMGHYEEKQAGLTLESGRCSALRLSFPPLLCGT